MKNEKEPKKRKGILYVQQLQRRIPTIMARKQMERDLYSCEMFQAFRSGLGRINSSMSGMSSNFSEPDSRFRNLSEMPRSRRRSEPSSGKVRPMALLVLGIAAGASLGAVAWYASQVPWWASVALATILVVVSLYTAKD